MIRDVAIVGTAGGEYGIRGFIDGTDLNTGQDSGAPIRSGRRRAGNETWKDGQEAGSTAASIWETATTTESDTFYQASAMPVPTTMSSTVPATTSGRRACWR